MEHRISMPKAYSLNTLDYASQLGTTGEHLTEVQEFLAFMEPFTALLPKQLRRLVLRFRCRTLESRFTSLSSNQLEQMQRQQKLEELKMAEASPQINVEAQIVAYDLMC
jgi:hypothetical protein